MSTHVALSEKIEKAFADRSLLSQKEFSDAVHHTISLLNDGKVRVAQIDTAGQWSVNVWVKRAILLYFSVQPMREMPWGESCFYDKIPLKSDFAQRGARAVPTAVARYGSFLARSVVLMPSYVNIGAYVDEGTMVDTWATVGSCAQIGKNVHLSGGVGIGGVLEPEQATPVIIENGAFIGSRCVVVEGVRIGEGAVLGAGVVITQSTHIIDVSQTEKKIYKGEVPARSVVIPGSYEKQFPAGKYQVPCVLIIGQRKASTDLKASLNAVLRDFNVSV